jgi:hypothetical protein
VTGEAPGGRRVTLTAVPSTGADESGATHVA